MTIAQGGLIQALDYNGLRTQVSDILGTTGTGDVGYGQAVTADTTVVSGTTIISSNPTTVKQWVALYNDMKKIADHQGTGIATLTTAYTNNVQSGKLIQFSDINLFSNTLTTLYNNRLNIANGQYSIESLISSSRTAEWGSPSQPTVQHSFTVTFASADAARYYFNSGGKIQFTPQLVPDISSAQNSDWQAMLTAIGIVSFGHSSTSAYNSSTGLSVGSPGSGFNQLSTTPLQIYTKGGNAALGAVYYNNDYTITATKNGAVLTFNVYFNDDDTTRVPKNPLYDKVTGTLTNTVTILRPSGSNVSLNAPTATNTTLLSA